METLRVDRHIFLYACGWYKQKNMIQDLKIIISKEHRWDIEDISINGVVNELLHIIEPFLLDINNGCDFKDLINIVNDENLISSVKEFAISLGAENSNPKLIAIPDIT
jgi:hypothetical protein